MTVIIGQLLLFLLWVRDALDFFELFWSIWMSLSGRSTSVREASSTEPTSAICPASQPAVGSTRSYRLADGIHMVFKWIQPGEFTMGSADDAFGFADERPQQRVSISSGFWLARTPVSRAEWAAVYGDHIEGDPLLPFNATWFEADAYCRLLSARLGRRLRLPTEREAEWARRAGSADVWPVRLDLQDYAWFADNSGSSLPAVKGKKPNFWGGGDLFGPCLE